MAFSAVLIMHNGYLAAKYDFLNAVIEVKRLINSNGSQKYHRLIVQIFVLRPIEVLMRKFVTGMIEKNNKTIL